MASGVVNACFVRICSGFIPHALMISLRDSILLRCVFGLIESPDDRYILRRNSMPFKEGLCRSIATIAGSGFLMSLNDLPSSHFLDTGKRIWFEDQNKSEC